MGGGRPAVAIVGAGAAGTATAWRLRELLGGEIALTVFERGPHVGGRAWDVPFAGTRVEVGASLVHSADRYAHTLIDFAGARAVPLAQITGEPNDGALWTTGGLAARRRGRSTAASRGIARYAGPAAALRLTGSVKEFAERWARIYPLQAAGSGYDTVDDLLQALDLRPETLVSLWAHLRAHGVAERAIDEIAAAAVGARYGQGVEVNAVAGEFVLAAAGLAGGQQVAIEGGSWTLLDRTLRKLKTEIRLKTAVTGVEGRMLAGSPSYRLSTTTGEVGDFDAVVIAAPLALAGLRLRADGLPLTFPLHRYQEMHTTLVAGELSSGYFGSPPHRRLPGRILATPSAGAPFSSVVLAGRSPTRQVPIYRITSNARPAGRELVGQLFSRVDDVYHFAWPAAAPVLTPGTAHLPFELRPGLFYACAGETVASAVEVEAVGGVNTALLVARQLRR
ncbi:MAG: FAD-dependent oxidoreductase [Propionicimonas sp.]|nr:FAD-dependent oxidoreductase [Propionicimonas sp.]